MTAMTGPNQYDCAVRLGGFGLLTQTYSIIWDVSEPNVHLVGNQDHDLMVSVSYR
jgi:hypothetical protein